MKVLIACEESGVVRDAFLSRGHDAISCDLIDTSSPGPHIVGDALEVINSEKWDLIIAHPPCTYLANSGVCHLDDFKNIERIKKMHHAAVFFHAILSADCDKICVENPIPHKYGIGKTYTQIIQPWMFGHAESKATCLWLKGLPKLVETNNVKELWKTLPKKEAQRLHYLSPSPERAKLRSKTYKGIAKAMADQWG